MSLIPFFQRKRRVDVYHSFAKYFGSGVIVSIYDLGVLSKRPKTDENLDRHWLYSSLIPST